MITEFEIRLSFLALIIIALLVWAFVENSKWWDCRMGYAHKMRELPVSAMMMTVSVMGMKEGSKYIDEMEKRRKENLSKPCEYKHCYLKEVINAK